MNKQSRRAFLRAGVLSPVGLGLGKASVAAPAPAAARSPEEATRSSAPPFHLGLVTYNLARDWDVPAIIKHCDAAGFKGVELRTTHKHGVEISLGKGERLQVKQRFADSSVRLVSLGTVCEFESPDPAVVEKNIDETRRWCELARDLGCLGVKVRPNGLPSGVSVGQTLDQIGQALSKCGDAARDNGVEIWLEVHGPGTQLIPNARRILATSNHPAVGACWNSNPTDLKDGSVREGFEMLRPYIRSCHINDLDSQLYPWRELFALLRGISFDRYTFAEIGEPSCEPDRFMSYYRALWDYHAGAIRP